MQSVHLQEAAVRYFLEVVRSGSISVAAARLFVSGSAVSRQIAGLESVLGVALFDRRPRGMVPSAAGELLAGYARRATLEADRVVSDIQALQGLRKGKVRVASSAGFALEFLPQVIADFQRRYPGIQFHLQVAGPADVTTAILNGDADIGLTYSRAAERDISVAYRQAAPVLVIMRPDHPLAKFSAVTLAQMQPYPLALPERENTVRQLFDIACSRRQLAFEPALASASFEALTSFVLHGGGLSISGEVTVRHRLRRSELRGAVLRERGMADRVIEVQTLTGRTLPEGARSFLLALKQQLPVPV
ncbi:MAG: LysR substrate-binding domain-containing protein [Burkholderiaceae bacterium]